MGQDYVLSQWSHMGQIGVLYFRYVNIFLVYGKLDSTKIGLEKYVGKAGI